jgi:ribosomal protein S13
MANFDYLSIQPRQSCITSFQTLYGIGKIKASRLNSFLFNHPIQTRFAYHFMDITHPTSGIEILKKIPWDSKVRLCVANHMRNKISTFCYQAFRLFQNLPTKGQRTKANAKSISNLNPYKSLRINMSFYRSLEVAFKKRELLHNERYDELKVYMEAQVQKEKMKEQDQKQKSRNKKQDFIKKQKIKK